MPVSAKICGLRDVASAQIAIEAGAAYLGFIFHPPSPRHIPFDQAQRVALALPKAYARIAVTVDADDVYLDKIMQAFSPHWLQLHGEETPERVRHVRQRFGLPVIKAIGIAEERDVARVAAYDAADHLLFDTRLPGTRETGGTGRSFDWSLLARYTGTTPWFLSGGLSADNVAAAVAATGAKAVDASSRLESSRGVKDTMRICQFLDEVKRLP